MSWFIYALLSALFAAITAILAKIGVSGINSNLATAIRTVVILIFAWSIVFFQKSAHEITLASKYTIFFLVLSGITTGLSWLFYFRALQLGEASKVVPIDKLSLVLTIILAVLLLKEKISWVGAIGAVLMTGGAILLTFVK